ncbi:polycystin-1 isoform X2 [Stigmatopora argus]
MIFWMVFITTAGGCGAASAEVGLCPVGSPVHLPSVRCFWLSEKISAWSEASASCQKTGGGRMAAADTSDLRHFLHHSFSTKRTVWVWTQVSLSEDAPEEVEFPETASPAWPDQEEMCRQMALGTPGQWRMSPCVKKDHVLCQKDLNESLPDPHSYVVGVLLMTGVYQRVQMDTLATVPDIEQPAVETQLFPGLWFSHAGQLTSVEMVVQPSSTWSLARLQILRPYCRPKFHLVPPGCSSLMNAFSRCAPAPLCNTTGGCGAGRYWCPFLETCLPASDPCSPYVAAARRRGFALPPRYPALAPWYHLVADVPLKISAHSQPRTLTVVLPVGAVNVYPDDIVAVQHSRQPGSFLHCLAGEASLDSPWRQSYLSLGGTAPEGGLAFQPSGDDWVDGVVCDLRLLYERTLHGGTEHQRIWESTTPSSAQSSANVRSTFGLNVVHPPLDEKNQIHVQVNVPTPLVVTVLSGENLWCSMSAPALETRLHFGHSCPHTVLSECDAFSEDTWFSSATLLLPSVGVQTLNVSVADASSSQSLNVTLRSHRAVSGLAVEPAGRKRMLVDVPQSFTAGVERGSSVTFSWVIDDLEASVYEGQSYSVVFKKPARYKLKVTASNPVSSQSQQLVLTVDEIQPLGEPEFLLARQIVAVGAAHLFILGVNVDIALPTTFTWDFGDGSSPVSHTESPPRDGLAVPDDRKETRAYVRHAVNVTYSSPGHYHLRVKVSNPYVEKVEKSLEMSVRPLLKSLFLNSSAATAVVNQKYLLEASTDPVSDDVVYTVDFGDESNVSRGAHPKVQHAFTAVGNYTVTVLANNTLSALTTWRAVEVVEKITCPNGPDELAPRPVSDFSLQIKQPYSVVREETLIAAVGGDETSANFYWTVDALVPRQQGSRAFRFVFLKAGQYRVRCVAQNSLGEREAVILVQVFERIQGLRIDCPRWENLTYLATHEEVVLVASVAKGSNLTYAWLLRQDATKHPVTAEGERFQFAPQTPGRLTIQVSASNALGQTASVASVLAVEPVTGAHVTTPGDTAASGELFNISVRVSTGSDLRYFWFVDGQLQALETEAPFLLHGFESVGDHSIKVLVQNAVSQCQDTKVLKVQEEIEAMDFTMGDQTPPFHASTNAAVSFRGSVRKGSDPHWEWKISGAVTTIFCSTDRTCTYTFLLEGIYTVSLNVSNAISWQEATRNLTVQDSVEGLGLNVSQRILCTLEEVTFTPSVRKGSDATFVLTFEREDWLQTEQVVNGSFATSTLPAGMYRVKLTARNQVSSAQISTPLQILENIKSVRLVSPAQQAVEALREARFTADGPNGSQINYTWIFGFQDTEPLRLTGKEVGYTPPANGSLSVTVLATNGICSKALNQTLMVETPVGEVRIWHQEPVFSGHPVRISAEVDGGSHLRYVWTFENSIKEQNARFSWVNHTFGKAGVYLVTVHVSNGVSHASVERRVTVEDLRCSAPGAILIQSRPTVFRSRVNFFEASVNTNCSVYKTTYTWEMFRAPDCASDNAELDHDRVLLQSTMSPLLRLPKRSLDVGRYCLSFTVAFPGTPLLAQRKTPVQVVGSPLVAVIKGGSRRLWPGGRDLLLDGSGSRDPDADPGVEDALEYYWTFRIENITIPLESKISTVTVPSKQLNSDTTYTFALLIKKPGRTPAFSTQTVTVSETAQLAVLVECVSCPGSSPTVLTGHCGECDDQAQYHWSAEDESGAAVDLDRAAGASGRRSSKLELRSDVVPPGKTYTFTLNVTVPGSGRWGSASHAVTPNKPPSGGLCELKRDANVHPLGTAVTYKCSGWKDEAETPSELIYTFRVAPCHPMACPVLTLYKGTRSTFHTLLPVGTPLPGQSHSLVTVMLLVEDGLGSSAVALNRTLRVPTRANGSQSKSQMEMWASIEHGNPQQMIPFSIALTSQLNQMDSGPSASELKMKRQIRENVTKALASLPIFSLLDVDQISSALALSTAVPVELTCIDCQEKVLEAVRKMIHVIQEREASGGGGGGGDAGVSVFDIGKNIVSIVGSSLAATSSLSAMASSSGQNRSRTLRAASSVTLSAISRVGALMRSLALWPRPGGAPLSFATPYIRTAAFYGDPADLLCSERRDGAPRVPSPSPGPACSFGIPGPLAAHLKSRRSEVVQVLLGLDESHSLLAAADPPISTSVVAMEISGPRGEPVAVRDLENERAIRVTLHSKLPAERKDAADEGVEGECLAVTLPPEGRLNFTVKAVGGLDENTGLYMSYNFSLLPGTTSGALGHVKMEMSSGSRHSLVKEWSLDLSPLAPFTEKTVFLSPLLNGTEKVLSISLTSSVVEGGPVGATLCPFSSLCRYYDVEEGAWSSQGLKPLEDTTLQTVHCLTRHLTMFGATLFVHPGAVVLLPPAGGPLNALAGMVCAVLILIHLLLGLIAHKLDHLDGLRLGQVPLCGRAGLYHYRVLVKTGWRRGAGTTAHVGIALYGANKSGSRHLRRDGAFRRGGLDQFHVETDDNLGEVWKIRIWHDNTGLDPSWYLQHVVVWDPVTDHMFFFLVDDWLSAENAKNGTLEKEILASCPKDLSRFRRILSSQLLFGIAERHLWLSLWRRPNGALFTRAQRVTCGALSLHLYLASAALWYGAVGSRQRQAPVSARLALNVETLAVGMVLSALLFPLQCLICFLFRKVHTQESVEMSVPPSPVCYSVEMDVFLGQSELAAPSFLSLSGTSGPYRDSPSSLAESKAVVDSSILDFWAASGLVPQTEMASSRASCDSLLQDARQASLASCARQLRRKRARKQLRLTSQSSSAALLHPFQTDDMDQDFPRGGGRDLAAPRRATHCSLDPFLTLSEENLLMSIEESSQDTRHFSKNNSDSGRDSPTTTSSFSNTQSTSCGGWSEDADDKNPHGEQELLKLESQSGPSLYRCPSVLSLDSVASTFLPSPSPDLTRCSSTTRIGIARGRPGRLFPSWALRVIYPLVAASIGACLAVVGIYASLFSRSVLLAWLASVLSAFLTSALLLEPFKVCLQALIYTLVWRPVDPEVEEQLAQETTVARNFGERGGKVRPPCGYGLLQAKEEARKVRALTSLMKHCVLQLLFLLLVLMVNYQDGVERSQGRLLHSAVRRQLQNATFDAPQLTSIRNCLDAERWISKTLATYLHQSSWLHLVGSPQLRHAHAQVLLGNGGVLPDLGAGDFCRERPKSLSLDFTQYHKESALFLCVSIQLDWAARVTSSLSISPFFIPWPRQGLDLQLVLMVFLLGSALAISLGELRTASLQRSRYLRQGKGWLQLLLAALSLAASVLHFLFLSQAASCLSQLRSRPDSFIHFHGAAALTRMSSQCAALLLTLLVLKLLGTLRFVRRWVVIIRVLNRAKKELWASAFLLLLLFLFTTHLGTTLFSQSVEDFSPRQNILVPFMWLLRGRFGLQRLCRVHPVLGPLYGLLLTGAGVWLLAKFTGVILIHAYRTEKADIYRPTTEPRDYEMVEFFIKRLKLWIGLTKAKEFRHRVKFEGMEVPPSRASQESRLSTDYSPLPSSPSSFSSPRPPSSSLSVLSEDSALSDQVFDVQPFLDRLLPCVNAALARFDRVARVTEEVYNLEMGLEDFLRRRKQNKTGRKEKCRQDVVVLAKEREGDGRTLVEVRRRRAGLLYANPQKTPSSAFPMTPPSAISFPRTRSSRSESESFHLKRDMFGDAVEAAADPIVGSCGSRPVPSPAFPSFPKRRAWHSGSSHSADAAQRLWLKQCGNLALAFIRPNSQEAASRRVSDGAPKKRKAWIAEEPG